ncbi:effector-associated constant component EACC1 [Streptomyces sp. 4N124]|uniref:effector-associated constant component EACC1 n=1 Tax=Streptomyces sp. 4N124 TaxID=3457420 RepID=UPI003FD5172B
MSVRIDVVGDDDALEDLWEWLGAERELRGRMRWETPPAAEGTMGSGVEIAVQVAELGLAGINTLLAAIGAWLTYRSTQAAAPVGSVTISVPGGGQCEIKHEDPAELTRVATALLQHLGDSDDPAA